MDLRWRRAPKPVLPSDRGFLKLAGEADLPLREQIVRFRELVSSDMDWTDVRKRRFRSDASRAKVATLLLTAASTVVLGVTAIPARAAIALPMVALVSVLTALEAFYNWRSRWILMEETQYRLNRLRDKMDYYLVTKPVVELKKVDLDAFFAEQQAIWSDVNKRWIEYRKVESSPDTRSGGELSP